MLFGQSIFQSVLDRLDSEEIAAAPDDAPPSHRIHGLNVSFAVDVRDGVSASAAQPGQAYIDNLEADIRPAEPEPDAETQDFADGEEKNAPAAPVMPPHLRETAPEAVAAELAITKADSLQSLNDKRRNFARSNHPDGIDPLFREPATIRMKIANLLIDEAIRRIELRAKLFG